jgi:hypothetical protein
MKAVIYQHEAHEGLGRFEPALRAVGFELVPLDALVERIARQLAAAWR